MSQLELVPQSEPPPDTLRTVLLSERDAEAMASVRAIVSTRSMAKEPHWGDVVIPLLIAYNNRGKTLPDWWIYSRFVSTFGTDTRGRMSAGYDHWVASDRLDELLKAGDALYAYSQFGWLKRLWYWRTARKARADLMWLLVGLRCAEHLWIDRTDFLRFKAGIKPVAMVEAEARIRVSETTEEHHG